MNNENQKISPAQIIVDLFELRHSYLVPINKWDRISHDYKYHFLSSAISLLIDKYQVKDIDIDGEIHRRMEKDAEIKLNESIFTGTRAGGTWHAGTKDYI